eukprot:CAMPEP_0114622484 /NCGR_PEP_ID=MMETSP0168-20121206/9763_1 /TAXON_ID=95228 ORGANISM="Vannella sp., Strain DIVA3 517/6/12" /NCGR_SAMPLE_ID=MMETSP0168 /ASSEMBLY_ACC=CAM_ASM_000044 /LENGTH=189 /DNA_ID=CAMNT_0001833705 /DNA_START=51 /DNA_END=620 /DNA_ORIENTATION=-
MDELERAAQEREDEKEREADAVNSVFYGSTTPGVVRLKGTGGERETVTTAVEGRVRTIEVELPSLRERFEAYERDIVIADEERKRRGVKPLQPTPSVVEESIAKDPSVAGTLRRLRECEKEKAILHAKKPAFKRQRYRGRLAPSSRTPIEIARDLVKLHMDGYEDYLRDKALLHRHKSGASHSSKRRRS